MVPIMARGWVRVYRTYNYIDKNPVIDITRTLVQDEGLYKQLRVLSEISNVASSTMHNWFYGATRNPQHHTVMAVLTSLGYEEKFVKKKEINLERERALAAEWLAKQPKRPKPKRKPNGRSK